MPHSVTPTVNVYFIRDGKLLLGRRQNKGWMDGYLCPPGGHMEPGETPLQAVIREIKEELDVDVQPEDLEFLCVAARKQTSREIVAYEFVVRDKPYEVKNAEPDMCSELVWVDPHTLPEDVITDFRQIIELALLGGETYLEIGYE